MIQLKPAMMNSWVKNGPRLPEAAQPPPPLFNGIEIDLLHVSGCRVPTKAIQRAAAGAAQQASPPQRRRPREQRRRRRRLQFLRSSSGMFDCSNATSRVLHESSNGSVSHGILLDLLLHHIGRTAGSFQVCFGVQSRPGGCSIGPDAAIIQ